jgi:hypothetical protein
MEEDEGKLLHYLVLVDKDGFVNSLVQIYKPQFLEYTIKNVNQGGFT